MDLIKVSCPGCESQQYRFWDHVRLSPTGIASEFQICEHCSLGFVSPRPSEDAEKDFYTSEYFERGNLEEWKDARLPFFYQMIHEIEKRSQNVQLLDIGCGAGFFLEVARLKKWTTLGIDLSERAVAYGREQLHLDLIKGGIQDVSFPAGKFNVITLWNVLDQVWAPGKDLKQLTTWLASGGWLALRVSNFQFHGWMHQVWKCLKRWKVISESAKEPSIFHLQMFDAKSIRNRLKAHGYETIQISNSHMDSMNEVLRGWFGKAGSRLLACFMAGVVGLIWIVTLGTVYFSPSMIIFAQKKEGL